MASSHPAMQQEGQLLIFFFSSLSALDQLKGSHFNRPCGKGAAVLPQAEPGAQGQGWINQDAINANNGPHLCGQLALLWEEERKLNYNGRI